MSPVLDEDVVWKLDSLYSGPDDPRIEEDMQWCRSRAESFSAALRGKLPSLGPGALLDSIRLFEELRERVQKLLSFGYLFFSTRTQDPLASGLWQSIKEFESEIERDTLFFELEWTRLDDGLAQSLASSPALAGYRHYLEGLRRYRPHVLSEPEEKVLVQKEPAGASAWTALFDKMLGQLRFGEKKRTESDVLSDLYHADREIRKNAALELTGGLETVLPSLTHIFNTILLDKSIEDRLRSYPHWLRARNLGNEADDAMVEALVRAVSSRYSIVERYYTLKRRLLGLDELFDYDRYAPVPSMGDRVYSWEEAKEAVLSAFAGFSPVMSRIAFEFFESGWVHAPVMPGKRSGAFSHPAVPSAHPYVFVNFTGKHRDIMVLAHEMGHGVHQYLARQQGLFNSETPLTTAESASVFGEMLVFRHLLERAGSRAERLALLCAKLEDVFMTVFRQIANNRFEDGVHNARRSEGELDPERVSSIWIATQSAMFGHSVRLLDHYRIWWSYIPHFIHSPGYVYAYAFGQLLVLALYRQYRERGPAFTPVYLEFLAAGGKARPDELLAPFGIDLTVPGFWLDGLGIIEDLLNEAEREAA